MRRHAGASRAGAWHRHLAAADGVQACRIERCFRAAGRATSASWMPIDTCRYDAFVYDASADNQANNRKGCARGICRVSQDTAAKIFLPDMRQCVCHWAAGAEAREARLLHQNQAGIIVDMTESVITRRVSSACWLLRRAHGIDTHITPRRARHRASFLLSPLLGQKLQCSLYHFREPGFSRKVVPKIVPPSMYLMQRYQ